MATYNVVIHYEGAWSTEIQASSEEEAKEQASNLFMNEVDVEEVWNDVDWDVCDCWEEK